MFYKKKKDKWKEIRFERIFKKAGEKRTLGQLRAIGWLFFL